MELSTLLNLKSDQTPVILAPMAGVTDLPFRIICSEFGADFTYSEMVSAKGLSYNSAKSFQLLSVSDLLKKPFGVQIFGSEPPVMADIAKFLYAEFGTKISLIDINMGCPAPKINSNLSGCALMGNIELAEKIISAVASASPLPVTVKFRKGLDENSINAIEFAKMAEGAGARAITVHGRTRAQMYSGIADWDIIAKVKASVNIPVIANGDVVSGESAIRLIEKANCDGIMIGRGACGNPFIFEEVKAALSGKSYVKPTIAQRVEVAKRHARLHLHLKGERSVVELRKHMAWYTHGIKHSAKIRQMLFKCSTIEEFENVLNEIPIQRT